MAAGKTAVLKSFFHFLHAAVAEDTFLFCMEQKISVIGLHVAEIFEDHLIFACVVGNDQGRLCFLMYNSFFDVADGNVKHSLMSSLSVQTAFIITAQGRFLKGGGRGDFLENVWYYFVMMQDVRNGNCEEKYFMLWWE